MNLKVNISQNPALEGAKMLSSLLAESKDRSILLMLSGGSAFGLLEPMGMPASFERVTITVLDERYSTDENVNNFAQLAKTEFYTKAKMAGASFIDTRITEGETLNEAEVRFDYALKNWIRDNEGGVIIATMGIGPDGHTAGIFPHADDEKFRYLFEQDEKLVAGYHVHIAEPKERLTVTNHFLREYVDYAVMFAVGEAKRITFEQTLRHEGILAETPARIIHSMKNVEIFTDIEVQTA